MDIQLKRGLIEICVLAAMLRGPTYGYKLIRDVSPYMEISESTLYPILKRLETANCLAVTSAEHNGRLRKYYSITPEGQRRIAEFLNDWKNIMKTYTFIEGEAAYALSFIPADEE